MVVGFRFRVETRKKKDIRDMGRRKKAFGEVWRRQMAPVSGIMVVHGGLVEKRKMKL
ncbi:hypothetical protein COLO4_36907 [Corchorus olitorius]|uniref:Uncharacterized protein n=1 Tax=Corchorus olitorius TaxID=93759 RepID=A0A1R3G4E5_9ROSI|nr:hypothetical protein COLO4_36907 [Corchorus olitorius]